MRRTLRGTATATTLALLWAAAVGCSSGGQATHSAAASTPTTSPAPSAPSTAAPSAAPAAAKITGAAFNEDADGARLVLSATAPLLYTSYEPRPNLLVVDLRDVSVASDVASPKVGGYVDSVKFEELDELGKKITRLSITHNPDAHPDLRSVGQGLAIAFTGATQTAEAEPEAPAANPAAVESKPLATAEAAPAAAPPAVQVVAPPGPTVRGEAAHALESVSAETRDGHVAVLLVGDGWFSAKDFALANPPRIVIDLPGVKNEVKQRTIVVKDDVVSRVRISQFQTSPEYVTRVVVDLARPMPHALLPDGERLAVVVGQTPSAAPVESAHVAAAPAVEPTPAALEPAPAAHGEPAPAPSVTRIAEKPAPVEEKPAPATVEMNPAADPVETAAAAPVEAPAAPVPAPVAAAPRAEPPAPTQAAAAQAATPKSEPVAAVPAANPPGPAPAPAASVKAAQAPPPATPPAPAPKAAKPGSLRGDALFEAAAAQLDQEQASAPPGGGAQYRSRTISEAQSQFTGEPISLDLKDADIKDVFRTISQLTGLNIVIDPDVRGTVTVQLEDVPWDQALDLILKQNSLGYVLENNIMRIATTSKLQAEEGDRARLAEARQAAEPTRTVIKKLSYSKASEIVPVLQSVMSKRGAIVVDQRTNTLIIRETPTYLPAVLQLIENLDTATPQVVIESRIVETTKSLGRSLGINWQVQGKATNETGNTTNLIFPNSIAGGLNVGLGNGPTVASLVLGNILNTFNLDMALTAAENQGLLKIISSPKVTSLTNTPALIQSGVQIPVQTTVNNTTTVIYVDATLKLDVTPQITAEGTILLTVNVTKREPAVALNLSLGQNVPLTIREYRGQVLVKDGGTTVIGGIFQINDQDQYNMIPGLWKIPVLGNLFKNKTRTEKHDELLIFITPRILRS
ncbi:MAG TPA: type IV pilus secretin PilQ [Thermoanaerobaculia bacterium]|nr:type IV pilus secretin PilQ [Thermoanaerobaculia bacterium]